VNTAALSSISNSSADATSLPTRGRDRAVIENIRPQVDGGQYRIKRVIGERVVVEADVFGDGHDVVAAVLRYRYVDPAVPTAATWQEVAMTPLGNDRWRAEFLVQHVGVYEYKVAAWIDRFLTWHHDLQKRTAAASVTEIDLQIGAGIVEAAAARVEGEDRRRIQVWARQLRSAEAITKASQIAHDPELEALMRHYPIRDFLTASEPPLAVQVDRERARYSAWYEMFPRSASNDPGKHGTLKDVEARLDYVASMGFDVLYLPPIHPIGRTFRKGKNNATEAQPDDVGSPWGIGAEEGGHKAILPALGTFADFANLVAAAKEKGLEIALDVAFQCAPDHPYVKEHPEWFRHRPDGTVQYAENPPKKYQDIYPFDFETEDWKGLWEELKSIFDFWIEHGVKIFRVDNPHTKPFPFWEWCIGAIKSEHPDVLFLSEAFTRPKIMYRLAKLGFTQSYTYFTWRNNKQELTEYMQELTQTEVREFFRPNFWPNTPDILHEYLQHGGRPAFMIRLVLASMLSANYGIYGPPYEHCWNGPREPGSEEYLSSEKYQVHHHDLNRPGSLKDLIARINAIRRNFDVLHTNDNLRFHAVDNDQLICFSKSSADNAEIILVVLNLDPHQRQAGMVTLPLYEMGLDEWNPFQVHDLLTDARYVWQGWRNYVELDPFSLPAHVFQVRRRVRSEEDFEHYF
jgi:starch synthase (maltosyl-transferring)